MVQVVPKSVTIMNLYAREKIWAVAKLMICPPNLLLFCYIGQMLCGFTVVNTVSWDNVSVCLLCLPRGGIRVDRKNRLPCSAWLIELDDVKALTLSSVHSSC